MNFFSCWDLKDIVNKQSWKDVLEQKDCISNVLQTIGEKIVEMSLDRDYTCRIIMAAHIEQIELRLR